MLCTGFPLDVSDIADKLVVRARTHVALNEPDEAVDSRPDQYARDFRFVQIVCKVCKESKSRHK